MYEQYGQQSITFSKPIFEAFCSCRKTVCLLILDAIFIFQNFKYFENMSMISNAVRLINLTTCMKPYMFFCWFEERWVLRTLFHVTYSNISCRKVKAASVVYVYTNILKLLKKIKLNFRQPYGLIEMLENIVKNCPKWSLSTLQYNNIRVLEHVVITRRHIRYYCIILFDV